MFSVYWAVSSAGICSSDWWNWWCNNSDIFASFSSWQWDDQGLCLRSWSFCQIMLQMFMRASIMLSLPAWTSSGGMLSTTGDFTFFRDLMVASTFSCRIKWLSSTWALEEGQSITEESSPVVLCGIVLNMMAIICLSAGCQAFEHLVCFLGVILLEVLLIVIAFLSLSTLLLLLLTYLYGIAPYTVFFFFFNSFCLSHVKCICSDPVFFSFFFSIFQVPGWLPLLCQRSLSFYSGHVLLHPR